jgi:hypothetical protein
MQDIFAESSNETDKLSSSSDSNKESGVMSRPRIITEK